MGKKILIVVTICVILGVIPFSITRDVSLDRDLWGGYEYQKEYILRKDVFLMAVDGGGAGKRLALVPEGSFQRTAGMHSSPRTVEEYEQDPKKASMIHSGGLSYSIDVKGVIKSGTRFQTYKLEKYYQNSIFFGYTESLTPFVMIQDGQFAGEVASIEDISVSYEDGEIFKDRPEELLIVK